MKNKKGYIIVLTLMLIAAAIAMVTALISGALHYQSTVRLSVEKEQARMLCFGGLQLALSQMSIIIPAESKKKQIAEKTETKEAETKKDAQLTEEKSSGDQKLLRQILPVINHWQTIDIDSKDFGISGNIKLYITIEDGKLNISNFLVSEKKNKELQAQSKQQSAAQDISMAKSQESGKDNIAALDELIQKELHLSIAQILKSEKEKLGRMPDDITELKLNEQIFMTEFQNEKRNPGPRKKQPIMLDIFTSAQTSGKLNPWLLTNGVKNILGLNEFDQTKSGELVKKFKQSVDWSKEWDNIFAPIYGKKFDQLPKGITNLFSSQFEVNGFSVIIYAKVGRAIQKICGVFMRDVPADDLSSQSFIFKLAKLYWI